jgi:ABC-2 type transport system permease protein
MRNKRKEYTYFNMKDLLLLTKINLLSLFGINKAVHSKEKKEKYKFIGFSVLMVFVFIMILFSSFIYSYLLASSLEPLGALNVLIAMMMTVSSLMILFTSIYKVNGILFGFNDYDTLMSLPVSTGTIVASRIIILYILNIAFSFIVMFPAAVVYCLKTVPNPLFYLFFIISFLFIPLVPIIIATVIGLIINIISSYFKRSNIINIIITIGLVIALMVISFSINDESIMELGNISVSLMNMIYKAYPLTRFFTEGICEGNIVSFLLFILISMLSFIIFCGVVGNRFKKLNTSMLSVRINKNYKITSLKESSPLLSLYKKELRRYFASTIYVVNTAIGMILLLILSFGMLFFGSDKIEQMLEMPGFAQVIGDVAPFAVAVMVSMTYTAACSISMEGKNLWIAKSLPVRPLTIFLSKIGVNLTITVPAVLISSLLFAVALKTDIIQTVFIFLTPLVYAFFTAVLGIIINLLLPNFDWKTEVTAVKQSSAALTATFGGMAVSILPIFAVINFKQYVNSSVLTLIITSLIFILTLAGYKYISTKGEKIFKSF